MPNHVHGIIVIETAIVRATRTSADEIRDTEDILVNQIKGNPDGSPQRKVRATRPPANEIRDTKDNPVNEIKDNLDGSPQHIVRASRLSADEIRDTEDILVNQIKGNPDGPPQQTRRPNGPQANSLGAMIGQFKSLATKRIWASAEINRHPIWQRNYYEHIIRDDLEYRRIIQYIETNPLQWQDDQLNPSVPGILEGVNPGR